MKFSSVEEDELALFLLPISASLPGGDADIGTHRITLAVGLLIYSCSGNCY